ncbi:unnamed protein product [Meloidogyne enterolobii]|uniref:Uncharacterized protein n=2 Tax=Meloidogyne enterolobii TaxID=390850 RepID=A0ACB1B837_MELEN
MPKFFSKSTFIFNLIINFLPSIKSLQFELLPQEFYLPFIDVLKIQKGHFLPIIKYQLKNKEEEYLNWLNDQIERENDEEDNKNNFKNFEEFLKFSEGILEPRKNLLKFQNNFLTKNEGFLNNFTCEATQKLIEDSEKRTFSVACLDENKIPKIIRSNSCDKNKNEECGEIETRSRFELKRGRFHCPSGIFFCLKII